MFLFSDFFLYGYSLMKKLLIILLILIAAGYLLPDTSIDDLEKKLDTATGEEKIRILDELAQAYWGVSPDKSIEYGALWTYQRKRAISKIRLQHNSISAWRTSI